MKQYSFPKPEHLSLRQEIEALFSAGSRSMTAYPLRVVYREVAVASGPAVKVMVSVSKRHFKHAVDRNRAKRQMREAYRLNKQVLQEILPEGRGVHLAFLWLSGTPVPSAVVHARVVALLQRMTEKICQKAARQEPETVEEGVVR